MSFFHGFTDELCKEGSKLKALKDIVTIAKENPKALIDVVAAAGKGKGTDVAKGLLYGSAGYGAMTGLGYRHPKTGEREPLHGHGTVAC